MNEDEALPDRSLRSACIHVAGHAMASRRLGYHSSWWVWEDGAGYAGRNELIGTPSEAHGRLIALAGAAAEAMVADRGIEAASLHERLSRESLMSDRDRAAVAAPSIEEVAACMELLTPMLTDLLAEAREQPDVATQVKRHKSRSYYR